MNPKTLQLHEKIREKVDWNLFVILGDIQYKKPVDDQVVSDYLRSAFELVVVQFNDAYKGKPEFGDDLLRSLQHDKRRCIRNVCSGLLDWCWDEGLITEWSLPEITEEFGIHYRYSTEAMGDLGVGTFVELKDSNNLTFYVTKK